MSDPRTASDPWPRAAEGLRMSEPPAPEPAPPPDDLPGERHRRRRKPSTLRSVIEWGVIIVVALVGALIIRTVLFQAFFIPSASMDPTLKVHDRILVNKLSYHMHPVHRGDIVVFKRSPNMRTTEGDIKDLVKRVIGLPGETIQSTSDGHIEINGAALSESYLPPGTALGPPIPKQVIPSGHYFVMGDNRTDSSDSRFFGPIARSQIIGRAFILIWPLSDFHFL
ncbi:MAG TPA: signal peptidase I [Acidimicrobiales bacterium]|nr:signal peptidase I [Acidimicrobiales bacterium]